MEIFGIKVGLTLVLSLWGAALSTILSILKVMEYWNNRFQIELSPILRGHVEVGHDLSIKNLSSKPVLLEYMELFTKNGKEEKCIWSPEDSFLNTRIEPHDTKVYNFSEGDYFPWKKDVYARLFFAGKKPIIKSIT
jgi:hypothetical protein